MDYKSFIREVPDFPKPGILFYDITTLLKEPICLRAIIDDLVQQYQETGITKVVGMESRGFILGSPLAYHLNAGFVPVRKPGKLPADVFEVKYNLEYGSNSLAIHRDASERKQAEGALKVAHEELEQRVEERTDELAKLNILLQEQFGIKL